MHPPSSSSESIRTACTSKPGRCRTPRIQLSYQRQVEQAEASGDGGYDALMQALRKAVKPLKIELPRLADYRVRIPPGGKSGALVETLISWAPAGQQRKSDLETFTTIGVDSDQMAAAVIATEKMLNAVITRGVKPKRRRKPSEAGSRPARRPKRSRTSAR